MLYQQPQSGPAQIDWGNPITRGLVFGFNASQPSTEAAANRFAAGDGSSGVSMGVGPFGQRISGNAGTAGNYRYWTGLTTAPEYTVLAVVLDSAGRGTSRNPFDSDDSNNSVRNFQLRFNASNQPEFIPFNTGATPVVVTGTTASSASGLSVIAASVDASKVARVYLNGVTSGGTATLVGAVATLAPTHRLAVGGSNNPISSGTPFKGDIYGCFFFNRALSAAEHASIAANPWQLFLDHDEEDEAAFFVVVAGSITGTLSRTHAADQAAASGTTTVQGTLARSNAADTVSAVGAVGTSISGTLATTNASDTVLARGSPVVAGFLARSNTGDTVAASGSTAVRGSLAYTNTNDSASASGIAGAVTGAVNYTNNGDVAAASGSGGLVAASAGAGFEMVSLEPSWRRALRLRAEKTERVQRVDLARKERKRAEFLEKLAAKETASGKTDEQIEMRITSLLGEWLDLAPTLDLTPIEQVAPADAYRAFMARVAEQIRRQEFDNDETAAEMLLLM